MITIKFFLVKSYIFLVLSKFTLGFHLKLIIENLSFYYLFILPKTLFYSNNTYQDILLVNIFNNSRFIRSLGKEMIFFSF